MRLLQQMSHFVFFFFFQAEDGIRDLTDWSSDVCSSRLRGGRASTTGGIGRRSPDSQVSAGAPFRHCRPGRSRPCPGLRESAPGCRSHAQGAQRRFRMKLGPVFQSMAKVNVELEGFRSDELRQAARVWVGKEAGSVNKEKCIAALTQDMNSDED